MKNIWRVKKFGIYFTWKIWMIITIIIWKKDVLLLADVFEKFTDTWLKFYGLDPCHYFSSLGLSWDAMLKMTDVKLEKISRIDMYLFKKNDWEEEFLILLNDTVKQITNTWKIIIQQTRPNTLNILIKIICMDEQWVDIFLMVDLSG